MSTESAFRRLKSEVSSGQGARRNQIAESLLGRLFPEQRNLVLDPHRRKALLCPRRSGKTFAAASYLVHRAIVEVSNCYYITSTRAMAKDILWKGAESGLKKFDQDFELKCNFHNTNLVATFPWGSTISLTGADTRNDIDKLRGQSYDLVIIDECKNFRSSLLQELIEEVIGPALQDRQGTLVLMGTPGNVLQGPFYEATRLDSEIAERYVPGRVTKKRFSLHSWTVKSNVSHPHLWEGFLTEKASYGWSDEHPKWRREYLGEWVSDLSAFVYPYNEDRDGYSGDLPAGHKWVYTLGLRFEADHDSKFAWSVCAHADTSDTFYVVDDERCDHLSVSEMADKIKEVQADYDIEHTVAMTDAQAIVDELGAVYGIGLATIKDKNKKEYISLVGSDIEAGRVKVRRGSFCEQEMRALVWGKDGEEAAGLETFACDSILYQHAISSHRFFEPDKSTKKTPYELAKEREIKRYLEVKHQADRSEWWERDYGSELESDEDYEAYEDMMTGDFYGHF